MHNEFIPTIGISLGDVNGIGPEVVLKALHNPLILKQCSIILYGSGKHLSKYKNLIGLDDFQFMTIKHPKQAHAKKINLINCYQGEFFELELGKEDKNAGLLSYQSLKKATEDLKSGFLHALVTAPISKDNIQQEDFKFPGHTEFLGEAFDVQDPLMFLVSDNLRIGVVTGHLPLEQVRQNLSQERISNTLQKMIHSLKFDFNIQKPKIAVLGLNPHAGEKGVLGKEEIEIVEPVIQRYLKKGNLVFGPFPTDGFFGNALWKQYDAVLAMYHDQGLTPFKMLAFDSGVNFTAGLPVVRTSPDHGTAFGIAGKNIADEGSMLQAIYYAIDIFRNRVELEDLQHNAVKPQKVIKQKREN